MTTAELGQRFKIPDATLGAAGVRDVADAEARDLLGQHGFQGCDLAGVVFTYRHPLSGAVLGHRVRLEHPSTNGGRYLAEPGCRWLFVAPVPKDWLKDPSVPVLMVEAEKSALALAALAERAGRKLVPIATGGCWGWKRNAGKLPTPDGGSEPVTAPSPTLDLLEWDGREAIIAFDANAATNPKVRAARRKLGEHLAGREASVRIAEVPALEGVNGPDDLVAVSGDTAALAMLDSARPFAECALAETEAAITALEADKKSDPLPAVEAVAAVGDESRRALLVGKLAGLKVPGLTKAVIEGWVAKHRAEAAAERKAAAEAARCGRLAGMQIDPAGLVHEIEQFYAEHAYLPEGAAIVLALLTLNTWTFDVFDSTPYMVLESAGPGCGKNRVLIELMGLLVREPLPIVSPNVGPLFRAIEDLRPTILMSEAEALAGNDADAKALREILNEGYKRGAKVPRCVGDDHAVQYFDPYCPKFFASIGGLRGALLTRCIVIHMSKRPAGFPIKGKRQATRERAAKPLRERIEAYALQVRQTLTRLAEAEPDEGYWPDLTNREGEVWGPLLMHARIAGPQIEERAHAAACLLAGLNRRIQAQDSRLAKGREVVDVLREATGERFRPGDLVEALSESEVWGADLGGCRDAKAKAKAIGRYLAAYRMPSYKRDRLGTGYDRLEAITAIESGLPEPEPEPEKVAMVATVATSPMNTRPFDVATTSQPVAASPAGLQCKAEPVATEAGKSGEWNGNCHAGNPHKQWPVATVATVATNPAPQPGLFGGAPPEPVWAGEEL